MIRRTSESPFFLATQKPEIEVHPNHCLLRSATKAPVGKIEEERPGMSCLARPSPAPHSPQFGTTYCNDMACCTRHPRRNLAHWTISLPVPWRRCETLNRSFVTQDSTNCPSKTTPVRQGECVARPSRADCCRFHCKADHNAPRRWEVARPHRITAIPPPWSPCSETVVWPIPTRIPFRQGQSRQTGGTEHARGPGPAIMFSVSESTQQQDGVTPSLGGSEDIGIREQRAFFAMRGLR